MNWLKRWVLQVRTFLDEVRTELRKSTWPAPSELMESTLVVIISMVLLSVFVGVSDTLLAGLVRLMVR